LLFANGAGSTSRQSLGTTLFGGMVFATILNLTFVPVLYVVIVRLRERLSPARAQRQHLEQAPTIERGADGGLVVIFPDGANPGRYRVPAVDVSEES
jgi:hypothetical protein